MTNNNNKSPISEQQNNAQLQNVDANPDEAVNMENNEEKTTSSSNTDQKVKDLADARAMFYNGKNANFRKDSNSNASKSFKMNEDFLFSDSLTLTSPEELLNKPEIQKLRVIEYQPDPVFTFGDYLAPIVDFGVTALIGEGAVETAGKLFSTLNKFTLQREIWKVSKDPEILWSSTDAQNKRKGIRNYFSNDPVQQVQNMFTGGAWLNTYELPFYDPSYLTATNNDNWSQKGIEKYFGKTVATILNGYDFPANPEFKADMKKAHKEIKTEFFLVNSNDFWLEKNFKFIHAIFAGSTWMHLKRCIIQSPNVYYIECPGRFQIYWAAMDIEVSTVGKLRQHQIASAKIKEDSGGISSLRGPTDTMPKKSSDDATNMLWPDAWKMTITFKDLTTSNFNLYGEYHMHGYNESEIMSLSEKLDWNSDKIKESFSNYIQNMSADVKNNIKTYSGNILELLKDKKEAAKEILSDLDSEIKKTQEETTKAKHKSD